jgi:hypothetical protein
VINSQCDVTATLIQNKQTVAPGGIVVEGNVEGSIQIENKHIEVNADHGAVVNVYDTQPRVKKRDAIPQPVKPIRGFVNRVKELERLRQVISASEIALIYGVPGLGRSALLRQVANSPAAHALPDGVLYMEGVEETGLTLAPEDMVQRIFDKSFESEPELKVNFDVAQTYLSNLNALVILNGLGFPTSSFTRVADLFSRGAVFIESESPVGSDIMDEIRLGPLPRKEAIELLVAKSAVPQEEVEAEIVDAICALLADVPLAITTAAQAIRENQLSLVNACKILMLVKTQSTDEIRCGIERAYGLAHATLSDLEKEWLAAAAFAPGISIDPKYLHTLADDPTTAEQTQARMQAMGLLTANSPRLRIDPGLRDLVRRGIGGASYQSRFVDYLKSTLGARSLDWSYCSDELGNILGMIDWSARQQRWSDVIALGRDIDPYLTLHGLWEAWGNVLNNVLQSAQQLGDRVTVAWALHQLGTRALALGLNASAIELLRQALRLRSELGDRVGMAYTQHNLDLLIPPPFGNNDGGQPPHKPISPIRPFKILGVASIVVLFLAVSSFVAGKALYSTIHAPTPGHLIPDTANTLEATEAPTLPSTETATATMTSTSTPTTTPTRTPTRTSTPTSTDVPVVASSGIGVPRLSTNQVFFGAARCDPGQVTIQVTASDPAGIKVLIFFHRLHEIATGKDSGWSDGIAMNPKGNDLYTLTVSGNRLLGKTGFTSEIAASYQFIIQAKNGKLVRSPVYMDLVLSPCGSKQINPPDAPTEPPVILDAPITGDPAPPVSDPPLSPGILGPISKLPFIPKFFVPTPKGPN